VKVPQSDVQPLIDEAPDELITKAVDTLNKSLADELLPRDYGTNAGIF